MLSPTTSHCIPDRPVVCFDETSTQLLADTRPPIPVQPGQPRRQDYEYRRGGTRNIFLTCEPLAGWRHVAITERRTMKTLPTRCGGWLTWPTQMLKWSAWRWTI